MLVCSDATMYVPAHRDVVCASPLRTSRIGRAFALNGSYGAPTSRNRGAEHLVHSAILLLTRPAW